MHVYKLYTCKLLTRVHHGQKCEAVTLLFIFLIDYRSIWCRDFNMARNFGHARAVNIQTWENLKQYGYTKL